MKRAIFLLSVLFLLQGSLSACDCCRPKESPRPIVFVRIACFNPFVNNEPRVVFNPQFMPTADVWAMLCPQCASGEKRNECVKCGRPGARIQAMLCSQCAAGDKGTRCVKCGKIGANIPARLCDQCGFGQKKNECIKCGKL